MLKSAFLCLIFISTIFWSNAQLAYSNSFKIGETAFSVRHNCDTDKPVLFIHLHESESTAINTMMDSLNNDKSYCLAVIKQKSKRFLSIQFRKKEHLIDPNRIFTSKGTVESYRKINRYFSLTIAASAVRAGDAIISEFIKDRKLVVSLHNNRDNGFSIDQYLAGNKLESSAEKVYKNQTMDIDNFILTTDPRVFDYFSRRDINVVLQRNENIHDDGSLSVYCGRYNIPYMNLEVQIGDIIMQRKLLSEVLHFVDQLNH